MSFWDKIRGISPTKGIKQFEPNIHAVNAFENNIKSLTDEGLRNKTKEFKERLNTVDKNDKAKEEVILKEILPEAFAVVREAARRTLGQRHFDVQIIGGSVLNSGAIAEMRTGEGKTLVATLPAYLNALSEIGRAHV